MSALSRILLISDNRRIWGIFCDLVEAMRIDKKLFSFRRSPSSVVGPLNNSRDEFSSLLSVDVSNDFEQILECYDLILSLHCGQIFPAVLVKSLPCINLHPGYIPYNRGVYSQVFSIINGLPFGATLHLMDEKLDQGKIIDQQRVPIFSWDTSLTVYERTLEAERTLLSRNLQAIIDNNFETSSPVAVGNINYKRDFANLCRIDLRKHGSFSEFIDLLRALSHGEYRNAYFVDEDGTKVYLKLELDPEVDHD